jgi:hypothetical protein
LAKRVAEAGEPFVSSFEAADVQTALRTRGFTEIDDRGPKDLFGSITHAPRWLLPRRGAHVVVARTPSSA